MTTNSPDLPKAPEITAPKSPWPAPPRAPQGPWQAAERAATDGIKVDFVGKRGAIFWLALRTGFFTILTLGFYRFWMKTRMRRWYWSAIRPGGHPMEYVGDPMEKLLGFFIAVVVLTFYIGIVNLLLMFVSFSVFSSASSGYLVSFVGVIPIWFYARYRARRYVLARTRWRGVRFGLEPGAWTYAGKALWYWLLTLVSLGLLWPRMTFLLEKFRTDRTFFGSAKLHQGGRWPMLYRAAVPWVIALVATIAFGAWVLVIDPVFADMDRIFELSMTNPALLAMSAQSMIWPERLFLLLPLSLGLLYGGIHYRWMAKRLMANHKSADSVRFASSLRPARVTIIYVLGVFISYLVLVLGITALVFVTVFGGGATFLMGGDGSFFSELPRWVGMVVLAAIYLATFLMWGVFHNVFVTFPLMRHMALTTTLPKSIGIENVSQRARDELSQAEGFAEALDLGAAI